MALFTDEQIARIERIGKEELPPMPTFVSATERRIRDRPSDAELMSAYRQFGSARQVAIELGIGYETARRRLRALGCNLVYKKVLLTDDMVIAAMKRWGNASVAAPFLQVSYETLRAHARALGFGLATKGGRYYGKKKSLA